MFRVIWDDDVYGEVASTWIDVNDRLALIDALHEIDRILQRDPKNAGAALSEGLFWIDFAPVRAIYSIDQSSKCIESGNFSRRTGGDGERPLVTGSRASKQQGCRQWLSARAPADPAPTGGAVSHAALSFLCLFHRQFT